MKLLSPNSGRNEEMTNSNVDKHQRVSRRTAQRRKRYLWQISASLVFKCGPTYLHGNNCCISLSYNWNEMNAFFVWRRRAATVRLKSQLTAYQVEISTTVRRFSRLTERCAVDYQPSLEIKCTIVEGTSFFFMRHRNITLICLNYLLM